MLGIALRRHRTHGGRDPLLLGTFIAFGLLLIGGLVLLLT